MTEQERAAALADEIGVGDIYISVQPGLRRDRIMKGDTDLIISALRAYARPATADLRDEIAKAIYSVSPWVYLDGNTVPWPDTRANYVYQETAFKAADAVLSILPQTQEGGVLTDMRETLQRLIGLTPSRAGSFTASDLHLSVKAIAASAIERLDRAAGKDG